MSNDYKIKANIIIHSFATSAAVWSGFSSAIPVVGPIMGDTVGLTALTIAMTSSLAKLFGKRLDESALWSFGAVVTGMIFGTTLLRGLVSLLPGMGTVANATVTFTVHEAMGWGLFSIFEQGLDPTKMSKDELATAITLGKKLAQTEKDTYGRMLNKLSPDARAEVERLQKEMAKKNISETESKAISDRIVVIFESAYESVENECDPQS